MNLSLYEQETIINYNEAEKTAGVYTHNKALRCKLERLAQEHPEDCRLEKASHDGQAVDYTRRVQLEKHSGRRWKRHEMP